MMADNVFLGANVQLPVDIGRFPLLDKWQLGHLRHIDNLSRQPPNDWSLMSGRAANQEDFGGYRFQLAYMAYALGLTYFHRLPAAPGVFRPIFQCLIEKMLHPAVWMYWRDVSRGGAMFNAHLADQLSEQWNPVERDNIMYSAYVQSMALMYDVLFNDHRYAEPGALTFNYWSFFWGGNEKRFEYDQYSLNQHLYWKMVESGYLGIACEPNCIFQICNQPAILGFRLHDILTGGSTAEEVTRSYEHAWEQFGRLGENGHYTMMLSADTKTPWRNDRVAPWIDAWCGALMNSWNRDFVRQHYERQIKDILIKEPNGMLSVKVPPLREINGHLVDYDWCDFGWVAVWASEMGDAVTLKGLLRHADCFMDPTWANGGLYYPRNDQTYGADGHLTVMEPLTGNALLAYARLNVADGLWGLYNRPWERTHFEQPALTDVASDVEVSRAWFDVDSQSLVFTVRHDPNRRGDATIVIGNVGKRGPWTLFCDGNVVASGDGQGGTSSRSVALKRSGDTLELICPGGEACTFVLSWGRSVEEC
jgi:hypothetical protein